VSLPAIPRTAAEQPRRRTLEIANDPEPDILEVTPI
jgi:hypothetical protein